MNILIHKIKNNKLLFILLIIIIISIIIGILFPSIISNSNKKLILSYLDNFFYKIKKSNLNYTNAFISSISTNTIISIFIWLLGISIIGILFIIALLIIKSFILGFSFSSIITSYGLKGIIIGLVYIIPLILNLFIYLVLCYYAIDFSLILFNYLFKKRTNIGNNIVKRYIKVLIISIIFLLISSLIEIYIIPNVIVLLL